MRNIVILRVEKYDFLQTCKIVVEEIVNEHPRKYFLIFGRGMRESIQIRWIVELNVRSIFNGRLKILIRMAWRKKFINWNKINYPYIHWFYPFIRSTSLIVLPPKLTHPSYFLCLAGFWLSQVSFHSRLIWQ